MRLTLAQLAVLTFPLVISILLQLLPSIFPPFSLGLASNMPKKLSKPSVGSSTSLALTSPSSSSSHGTGGFGGLPSILVDDLPLPRLIVFDLDYTLWPFWVDTHVSPPLKTAAATSNQQAVDRLGDAYHFYADVPKILYAMPLKGVRLAVASRTTAPDLARELLKLLHVNPPVLGEDVLAGVVGKKEKPRRALELFDGGLEIYPTSKLRHFEAIARRTGVPYNEMLFFDDESRNREVESLGVTMWLVKDGVTWEEVEKGVAEWRRRRGLMGR